MKLFLFEIKRLLKNHSILLVILLGLFLSVVNIALNHSYHYQQEVQSQSVESYPMQFLTTLSSLTNQNGMSHELSPGLIKYYEIYGDDRFQSVDTSLGYQIGPLELEYQYIQEAFAIDQIALTESEQSSLAYMKELGTSKSLNDIQITGAVKDLLLGNQTLYGTLPLILIVFLLLRLEEEDEAHQKVYYHTLPINRKSLIRVKLPLSLVLTSIYLITVISLTHIISYIQHGTIGDWLFPMRNLFSNTSLPAIGLFSVIVVTFILKVLFMVSIAFLVLSMIKEVKTTQFIFLMLLLLGFILTNYYEIFQINANPLFMNIFEQFTGKLILDPNWHPLIRYTHTGTPISIKLLVTWSLASILMIELAATLLASSSKLPMGIFNYKNQKIDQLTITNLFKLEISKLEHFISFRIGLVIIFVPILVFLVMMIIQDQQAKTHLLSSPLFENDYPAMQANYQKQIRDNKMLLQEAQNEGDLEQSQIYGAIIASDELALQYVNDLLQPIERRYQTYKNGDGKNYYQTFDAELAIWYNPKNIYGMEDQLYWMPRREYYQNGDYPTLFGYHVSVERLKEMSQRNIRPYAGAGITLTHYDKASSIASHLQDQISFQLSDQSALGLLYRLFQVYRLDLILIVTLLIFLGTGYSLEGSRQEHLYWLYTLPIERCLIFHQKWRASLKKSIQYIFLTVFLIVLTGVLLDGIGQWSLPILEYIKPLSNPNNPTNFNQSYQWINLGEYVSKTILLLVLSVSFVLTLSLFLSNWLKNRNTLYFVTLFICISGYLISRQVPWSNLLPFKYLNVSQYVDGSIIFHFDSHNLPYIMGLIILCLYTLLFYGLSRLIAKVRRNGGLKWRS